MHAISISRMLNICVVATGLTQTAAAPASFPAPLRTRAVIDYDKVVGFPDTVPGGMIGQLYLRYKPLLRIANGCVPYPAVDAKLASTSGGLDITGDSNAGCTNSTGQVYARASSTSTNSSTLNGTFGLMYAWYWPKDSPASGLGHRHDIESSVVWLSSASLNATVLGVAASAHGGYAATRTPVMGGANGTSPIIRYESIFPLDHSLFLGSKDDESGAGAQPLVAWEAMPKAARLALTNTSFGEADVHFRNGDFEMNLVKAALPAP